METERGNYVKQTSYIFLANAAIVAIGFLSEPILARLLGPSQYGIFALIFSTSTLITSYIYLSINSGVLFFASKWANDRKKIGDLIATSIGLLIALSGAWFIPLYYAVAQFSGLSFSGFLASFFLGFCAAAFIIYQALLQGLKKFKTFSIANAASSLLAAALAIGAAYLLGQGQSVAWGRTAALALVAFVGLWRFKRIGRFDWGIAKRLAAYSLPLGIAGLFSSLIVIIDRYFLARFFPISELGFYDIAISLVSAVLPFITTLLVVMAPNVIREQRKAKAYYARLISVMTLALTGIGLGFFYFSDIIVTFLLGSAYLPASLMMKIIAVALPLMGIYSLNGSILPSIGKTVVAGTISIALVLSSFALNFLLVPRFGGIGAALANLGTYGVVCAAGVYYLKRQRDVQVGHAKFQLVLFWIFDAAYFWIEQGGFWAKVVTFGLFALITAVTQKKMIREIIREVGNAVPGMQWLRRFSG